MNIIDLTALVGALLDSNADFSSIAYPDADGVCNNWKTPVTEQPKVLEGWWCPKIKRVTFNGSTTIVWFDDDTYAIVKCSGSDKYDKKTAIAYALVKRMLGKVGRYDEKTKKLHEKEVDGNGFGCYLQKVADAAFDQQKEEQLALEKKRKAKAEHQARQEAEKKAAFERRVEERAKQLILERAAIDRANEIEDAQLRECTGSSCSSKTCTCSTASSSDEYVRPDKPFSKFTPSEKREYWRAQNAKRRGKK